MLTPDHLVQQIDTQPVISSVFQVLDNHTWGLCQGGGWHCFLQVVGEIPDVASWRSGYFSERAQPANCCKCTKPFDYTNTGFKLFDLLIQITPAP